MVWVWAWGLDVDSKQMDKNSWKLPMPVRTASILDEISAYGVENNNVLIAIDKFYRVLLTQPVQLSVSFVVKYINA